MSRRKRNIDPVFNCSMSDHVLKYGPLPRLQNLPPPQTEEGAGLKAAIHTLHDEMQLVNADYSELERRILATVDFSQFKGMVFETEVPIHKTWDDIGPYCEADAQATKLVHDLAKKYQEKLEQEKEKDDEPV